MLEKIIELIETIIVNNENKIVAESLLKDDLGLNSYETAQLFGMIEDEFDIAIPSKEIRDLKNIQNIMDYLSEKEGGIECETI